MIFNNNKFDNSQFETKKLNKFSTIDGKQPNKQKNSGKLFFNKIAKQKYNIFGEF